KNEIRIVQDLAHKIWPITFKEILTTEQIDYMLNWMYSIEKLESQIENGHQFFIYELNNEPIGFLGIEQHYLGTKVLRIHKVYVQPEIHGKGIGKEFMLFAKGFAV